MAIDRQLSDFVAQRNLGTLATVKRDGRPQLSNVSYTYAAASDGEDSVALVRISLTDDRAKVKNLRRDPRASLLVQSSDGWTYAVVEGDMVLTDVATDPGDEVVEELIEVYRAVAGKDHPDWDEFRDAMVADKRLVGRLHVSHAYGLPAR